MPFQKPGYSDPYSLLDNVKGWRAADQNTATFIRSMKVMRQGRKEAQVACITVPTKAGRKHKLTLSVVNVVGKLQIVIDGKALLTMTDSGRLSAEFTAPNDSLDVCILCADRNDAKAIISELMIEDA